MNNHTLMQYRKRLLVLYRYSVVLGLSLFDRLTQSVKSGEGHSQFVEYNYYNSITNQSL